MTQRQPTAADGRLSRTLENAILHIRGEAQWFSARNKDAVIYQLVEAQKEVAALQAVADAARECADMLVFTEGERTFGQVTQRAMLARDKLREALRQLDGEG
jgi:hypothetical protein